MRKWFVAILLIACSISISAQSPFRVMFYNAENLFDVKNDSLKNEDEFTPEGTLRWTYGRYWDKLRNISRVITAVGEMQSPALVGLCEVENDSVVFDLTRRSPLRAQDYQYVMTNSPDERGIDVALLYQRDQFKLLTKNEYVIHFTNPTKPTRNLLYVKGLISPADTLHIFVCHFPSRSGGQMQSEPARIDAAALVKAKTDSIFCENADAKIIVMGDFNDHPTDKSLQTILRAGRIDKDASTHSLFNLLAHRLDEKEIGSYKFQGNWEILDQIIVSRALLPLLCESGQVIYKSAFLLEEDRNGGYKPFRTYSGPRYNGGFSDHLPVYIDIIKK